jgi:hypothetical protein
MNGLSTKYLPPLLLIFLAVLSAGCGTDKCCCPGEPGILPLAVGYQWTGVSTAYDSTGTVEVVDTLVYVITHDTTIGGETWYVMASDTVEPVKVGALQLLAGRGDGIWVTEFGVPDFEPYLLYKYPTADGETFMLGVDSHTATMVQVSTIDVTVPAGVFNCYCYMMSATWQSADYSGTTTTTTLTEKTYLAPGTGYVKTEYFLQYDDRAAFLAQCWELRSTSFAP